MKFMGEIRVNTQQCSAGDTAKLRKQEIKSVGPTSRTAIAPLIAVKKGDTRILSAQRFSFKESDR